MSDFSRWVKNKFAAFWGRQDEFDQALTSLAIAVRDRPTSQVPGPVRIARDPDSFKYHQFGARLDRILAGAETPGEILWRTLWIRQCKNAVMDGDHAQLEQLIVVSEIMKESLCKSDSADSQMGSG